MGFFFWIILHLGFGAVVLVCCLVGYLGFVFGVFDGFSLFYHKLLSSRCLYFYIIFYKILFSIFVV